METCAYLAVWLSLLTTASPTDQIISLLEKAFAEKGKAFPYYAEYDLAMPPMARIGGSTEKRRVAAVARDTYYTEVSAARWRSRVLLKSKQLYWSYATEDDSYYFTGVIRPGKQSPEAWLSERQFVHNSYTDLDKDLVSIIRELLEGSKSVRQAQSDQDRVFTVATSAFGQVQIKLTNSAVHITTDNGGRKPGREKTLLRYAYHKGKPPWSPDPAQALIEEFKKADSNVHFLKGEITYFGTMAKYFGELPKYRVIAIEEAKELALRYRYLLPKDTSPAARKVGSYRGELVFEFAKDGKTYVISQAPPSRRPRDDDNLKSYVTQRRRSGDYAVLEVTDPGVNSRLVYYISKETTFVVSVEPHDFRDRELDKLIGSFVRVERKKSSTGKKGDQE